MKNYGEKIKKARERAGVTAASLAERLGWSRAKVSSIETGRRRLAFEDAEAIADALDIEIGDLVSGEWVPRTMGERIKMLRRDRGWTQEQLAERLGGTLGGQISGWEKDRWEPSDVNLLKLSTVFGVSEDYLRDGAGHAQHDQLRDAVNELMRNHGETLFEIAELLNKAEKSHPGMAEGFLLLLREGYLDTPEDVEVVLSVAEILRERVRKGTL